MLGGKGNFASVTAAVSVLAVMPSCSPDVDGGLSSSGGAAGTTLGSSGGGRGGGRAGSSGSAAGSVPDASASGGRTSMEGGLDRGGSGGQPSDDGGDAGGPDGTEGGTIESGRTRITVHGTVIDYWRHRLPNVAVYLGTSTTVTDDAGQFTFEDVTPPYDIGLAVRVGLIELGGREDAWLFRGLTRADPTLQVRDGLEVQNSTGNDWAFQNFPPRAAGDGGLVPRTIGIAFGSPDTIWNKTYPDPNGTGVGAGSIDFEGPSSSEGTARALLWETPVAEQVSPTRYVAFDEEPLTIDETTPKTVTFDMSADDTAPDQVTGVVMPSLAGAIQIDGYVRFDDGSPIHIVQLTNAAQSFQMLMPKLPASSVTIAALIGSPPDGPFTVAHLDGLTPGQSNVQVNVPAPASLVAPADGAGNVSETSMFEWSASPQVARIVVSCKGPLDSDGYTTFNVVTKEDKTELPSLGGASAVDWPKGRPCKWSVEIHGAYATVDAATGPLGYLDPFSFYHSGEFWGPKRDDGRYSLSSTRALTTAP
jgi:hypothetical protein